MKLIYEYSYGDGYTYSGIDAIPFEYESKEKFVFDALEKYKDHPWKHYREGTFEHSTSKVEIFPEVEISKFELESIEHSVYTLEEWFEKGKLTFIQ
jgi:hypothetical protein